MAEFLTRDISFFFSDTPEQDGGGAFNDFKTAGTDFTRAQMRGRTFGIPTLDKISNEDLVGTGHEFATNVRNNYWTHPVMTVGEDVNTENMAVFLANTFGGVNAAPAAVTGNVNAKEHILLMQTAAQGRQLPSRNIISSVGYIDDANPGADFMFAGVVPDSFTISQTRADTPTWSVDLVGSGRWVRPLPTGVRTGLPTDVLEQNPVHGAAVTVSYDDGTSLNLSALGKVRSWTFTYNNNLRRDDRRPGDPFLIPNDPTSGAYVRYLLRGPRTATASITVSLSEDLREFLTHQQNRIVTNLSFLMKGYVIPGVTPTNHTVEIKMPRSVIRGIGGTDDNDDAALTLDFFPMKGTGEYVTARIINTRATALA
jgi:hypothetical protein